MLSTGETPEVREVEDHIGAFCNMLQGFLLLCQGSSVGAGPTLRASIRSLAKQVIDHSLSLLRETVSSYGSLLLPPFSAISAVISKYAQSPV